MPSSRRKQLAASQDYVCSVFVNCPYDPEYLPLLHAILFAIQDSGFRARIALEASGSSATRIDRIRAIIEETRLSIHDISRVELDKESRLPRFNMPFECGFAWGAMCFASPEIKPARDLLLLAAERFQDKQTLSDLAGQDARYHKNDPNLVIDAVRGFLASQARTHALPSVRGAASVVERYRRFCEELPRLAPGQSMTMEELTSLDYVPEWLLIASAWISLHPK